MATNHAIKFQKFYVTNGVDKARVSYSDGPIFQKQPDGTLQLRPCITLYAKDYSRNLGKIFADGYVNDTDYMTDYFDEGRVRIFPGDELYPAAKARCDLQKAEREKKDADRKAKYAARRAGVVYVACTIAEVA